MLNDYIISVNKSINQSNGRAYATLSRPSVVVCRL